MSLSFSQLHTQHITHNRVDVFRCKASVDRERKEDVHVTLKKPNELTVVGRIRTTVAKPQLLCRAKRRHSHIRKRRRNAVH